MNEFSKLLYAAALVALGLGLAFLCGPPADSPEVFREPAGLQGSGSPLALRTASLPLRLHADAPLHEEIFAGGVARRNLIGPATNGIVLSAAELEPVQTSGANEPREPAPPLENDQWVPLPPRPVDIDIEAAPLVADTQANVNDSRDKWLLSPPSMPRTFDTKGDAASSLASNSTPPAPPTEASAWWTRDTPRLQGLSSPSVPLVSAPQIPPPSKLVPVRSAEPTNSFAAPIPLGNPPIAAVAITRPAPPAAETYRTHRVADGDTLTRLAERYLKDPARAREILELNRDVLTNPDLLPIGAPLRIPGQTDPYEEEGSASASGSRMVPVATAPTTVDAQPRAELQGPTPLASNGW